MLSLDKVTAKISAYSCCESNGSRILHSESPVYADIPINGRVEDKSPTLIFEFGIEKYMKGYKEIIPINIWTNSYPEIPFIYGNI